MRVYRRERATGRHWKLAVVTGLLACVIAIAVMTLPELVAGRSVVSGSHHTTIFGGRRSTPSSTTKTKTDEKKTTTSDKTTGTDTQPQDTTTQPDTTTTAPDGQAPATTAPAPTQTPAPSTTQPPAGQTQPPGANPAAGADPAAPHHAVTGLALARPADRAAVVVLDADQRARDPADRAAVALEADLAVLAA